MLKKILKISLWLLGGLLVLLVLAGLVLYERDIPVDELKQRYTTEASKFVEIDGLQVHYRVEGQGPVLVLVHGTSGMLQTWDGWSERLRDSYMIVRMDIPAFGLTGPRTDGDYSVQMYTAFLEKFRLALKIDSFYLAGNSLGGLIAWQYALHHPAQVRKLVLVDPSGFRNVATDKAPLVFKMAQKYPGLTRLLGKLGTSYIVKKSVQDVYAVDSRITPGTYQIYTDMALRTGNRDAFVDRAKLPLDSYDDAVLLGIKCPTLLLWGTEDVLIDVQEARHFRAIPQLTYIEYPGEGHIPHEEIPETTAKDVDAFLKGAALQQ